MTPELKVHMKAMVDEANMLCMCGSTDKEIEESMEKWLEFIDIEIQKAERNVINMAHKPCECGKDHFGTPVRSVQGNITTYCQFSRVTLSGDNDGRTN